MKPPTSQAIRGHRIGRTDGSDRPSNGHFAEKSFHLAKIMTEVHEFLHMNP
jgi:hypothetical protein